MLASIDWRFPLLLALIFALGITSNRAFSVGKEDQARGSAFFSMRGFAFGLALVFSFWAFRVWQSLDAPVLGASGASGGDSLTLFSIMIGAIGIVITVLTGVSLTTAWRAIDDAGTALRRTNDLMSEIDRKILGANRLGLDFQRLAALVEAGNALSVVRGVSDEREKQMLRQQLVDAFTNTDQARTLAALIDVQGNASILREMGPLGREWLAEVARSATDEGDRRKAHRLIDALEQAGVDRP